MPPKPPPKTPTQARLHEAALRHLARYAATAAGLTAVLDRRIDRWARAVAPEPEAVSAARAALRQLVAKFVADGLVDDAAFAASRARRLVKSGHSRRAVLAHLAGRGIGAEDRDQAIADDPEAEAGAAIAFARRRRIGPFAVAAGEDPARHLRELGMFARAGFTQDVARRTLALPPEEAEALLLRLRNP